MINSSRVPSSLERWWIIFCRGESCSLGLLLHWCVVGLKSHSSCSQPERCFARVFSSCARCSCTLFAFPGISHHSSEEFLLYVENLRRSSFGRLCHRPLSFGTRASSVVWPLSSWTDLCQLYGPYSQIWLEASKTAKLVENLNQFKRELTLNSHSISLVIVKTTA